MLREAMAATADPDEDERPFDRARSVGPEIVGASPAKTSSATAVMEKPIDGRGQGLDDRFRLFLDAAVARTTWTRQELTAVARQQNIMLNGAIEAINEWSQERFGDWLINDGDQIHINIEMLKSEQS